MPDTQLNSSSFDFFLPASGRHPVSKWQVIWVLNQMSDAAQRYFQVPRQVVSCLAEPPVARGSWRLACPANGLKYAIAGVLLAVWGTGLAQEVGLAVADLAPARVATYHYSDYAPYGSDRAGLHRFGKWATRPVGRDTTWVYWGDPKKWSEADVEEHAIEINPKDGRRWVWVRAYINQKVARRYAISTTRAELIHDNVREDVTPPFSMEGQPYALLDFDGPFTVRVWGTIAQDPRICAAQKAAPPQSTKENGCDPLRSRKWFWQHTITPVDSVANTCWTNPSHKLRPALRQDEVWWDSSGGWTRGSGDLDPAGVPNGENVTYAGMQTIAKGVGFAWTGANGNCLTSAWLHDQSGQPEPID